VTEKLALIVAAGFGEAGRRESGSVALSLSQYRSSALYQIR
jgi:hypothetical protein